jgi:hypothetical protein
MFDYLDREPVDFKGENLFSLNRRLISLGRLSSTSNGSTYCLRLLGFKGQAHLER